MLLDVHQLPAARDGRRKEFGPLRAEKASLRLKTPPRPATRPRFCLVTPAFATATRVRVTQACGLFLFFFNFAELQVVAAPVDCALCYIETVFKDLESFFSLKQEERKSPEARVSTPPTPPSTTPR